MFRTLFALMLGAISTVAVGAAEAHAQGNGGRFEKPGLLYVQIASRPEQRAAIAVAEAHGAEAWPYGALVFRASNGWFAIVLAHLESRDAERLLGDVLARGVVPDDSLLTSGSKYVELVHTTNREARGLLMTEHYASAPSPTERAGRDHGPSVPMSQAYDWLRPSYCPVNGTETAVLVCRDSSLWYPYREFERAYFFARDKNQHMDTPRVWRAVGQRCGANRSCVLSEMRAYTAELRRRVGLGAPASHCSRDRLEMLYGACQIAAYGQVACGRVGDRYTGGGVIGGAVSGAACAEASEQLTDLDFGSKLTAALGGSAAGCAEDQIASNPLLAFMCGAAAFSIGKEQLQRCFYTVEDQCGP